MWLLAASVSSAAAAPLSRAWKGPVQCCIRAALACVACKPYVCGAATACIYMVTWQRTDKVGSEGAGGVEQVTLAAATVIAP
jgi:hypothetical protein